MKKLCTVILCVMLAFTIGAGCSVYDIPEAEGGLTDVLQKFDVDIEQNVTLQILENDIASEKGYLKYLLEAFNKEYEKYGITAVDADMSEHSNLEQDGPYGYGPDVLYQANDVLMKYVDGRHILPLPVEKLDAFEKIPAAAWDAYTMTVNGIERVCGVPVNIQAPMLYYRKDLLPANWRTDWDRDKNNVPDMVENWTDLYRYSTEVKEMSAGAKYGYMKSLNDQYFATGYFLSYGAYIFGSTTRDIGFSANDSEYGGRVLRQLASVMNASCSTDTITKNAYARLADGDYFATMTTPDVYTTFLTQLADRYKDQGLNSAAAMTKAKENLVMTDVPKLPAGGDLTNKDDKMIDAKMMGGINGYAVSAYTESPNACLAFIEFATNYECMMERNRLLGIAPARIDAATDSGELSQSLFTNLNDGKIVIMPSVRAISKVWKPVGSFLEDLVSDPYRKDPKYLTLDSIQKGLVKLNDNVYRSIFTL